MPSAAHVQWTSEWCGGWHIAALESLPCEALRTGNRLTREPTEIKRNQTKCHKTNTECVCVRKCCRVCVYQCMAYDPPLSQLYQVAAARSERNDRIYQVEAKKCSKFMSMSGHRLVDCMLRTCISGCASGKTLSEIRRRSSLGERAFRDRGNDLVLRVRVMESVSGKQQKKYV